ncbi:MAG: HEAT repeat domain-containing protein [Acidobacteriaceae bacterium]|nr:HEAT repeat domain-containing protein [Acidobacteriaceae bacterium]
MTATTVLLLTALLAPLSLKAQPDATSWDILRQAIDDKNPDKRKQAVTAIGSIGLEPDVVKLVEHGLRDDDPIVRQTGAAELGHMKSMTSIPALKAALDDPAAQVVFTAARVLWELGDRSGEEVLQDVLLRQQKTSGGYVEGAVRDARAKLRSKKGLALMGVNEASGALLGPFSMGVIAVENALKDTGAPGRILAAGLLAQKCDSKNIEVLETALRDEKNSSVKAAVAESIGKCGNKDDIPRLEVFLSNSNPALQYMSAAAIIKLTKQP